MKKKITKTSKEIQQELVEELDDLTHEMQKRNSRPAIFWNGIVKGLGSAVGATILFGLLITILSLIVQKSDAGWINNLADWIGLESYTQ